MTQTTRDTSFGPVIVIPTFVCAVSGATGATGSVVDVLAVVGVGVAVVVDVVLK